MLSTLLALSLLPLPASTQQVVVNPEVTAQSLSQGGVRAMFFMRLAQWPDSGRPVRVFVLGDTNPQHIAFSKNVLNTFPNRLRRSWDRLVFSGIGQAPIEVADEQEMRRRVASTPGAVGYLTEVKDDDQVRVLNVE